ncbi:hypothetical protein [Bradyrhizobium centrosematis]|uniref:hypothetical protein n=1 Tax=Bradyrhizobium centrosematis TaxID=1300039 RepID=UPI002168C3FA|nr:hypothetical protein [Bradyrhizobium centrosematis]MCS3762094.1 hypothetical protein [Bradyrhizobium centrosematis]MCS3774763.1 hypothetical protein [Bradyrhizobium centrosematis]
MALKNDPTKNSARSELTEQPQGGASTGTINVTLHPDGVAAPAHRAAVICREVIDLYFEALSKTDLSQSPPAPGDAFFRFEIKGPELSAEERRGAHERWVLIKAFQDLMRGVRGSLEEAYFFIALLKEGKIRAPTSATLGEILAPYRAKAEAMNFPNLMEQVNRGLKKPVPFAEAYGSLQSARNCLEHRDGVVGRRDVDATGVLKISVPRAKIFVEQNGAEIEVYENFYAEKDTVIQMRMETRDLVFRLGEPLKISARDFDDIAFACANFGTMLAQQLPTVPSLG